MDAKQQQPQPVKKQPYEFPDALKIKYPQAFRPTRKVDIDAIPPEPNDTLLLWRAPPPTDKTQGKKRIAESEQSSKRKKPVKAVKSPSKEETSNSKEADKTETQYETTMRNEPKAVGVREMNNVTKAEGHIASWIRTLLEEDGIGYRAITLNLQKMSEGHPISTYLAYLTTVLSEPSGEVEPGAVLFSPKNIWETEGPDWCGKTYVLGVILRTYASGEIGEVMYFPYTREESIIMQYPKGSSPLKDGARVDLPLGHLQTYATKR